MFNTKSKQIVAFVEKDTLYSEATLEPDIVSRWMSPDPLADHPTQVGLTPYHFAGNNPVYWNDPDGRCPWCVVWLVVEVGFAIYDAYDAGSTIIDPNASTSDKILSGGGFLLGTVLPGGGYGTIGKQSVKAVDKVMDASKVIDKANDTRKVVSKTEKTTDGARFIGDTDGKIIDTHTTPKGSYKQPDGSRTDVLQKRSHFDKSTKQNHGTSHTHETYKNVDSKGTIRKGTGNKTHKPTNTEVKNIETGKAKKIK